MHSRTGIFEVENSVKEIEEVLKLPKMAQLPTSKYGIIIIGIGKKPELSNDILQMSSILTSALVML
jgi:hypothetical protein